MRLVKLDETPKINSMDELRISYGNYSNGYLLQVYSFAIKNNPYDFVRRKGITVEAFIGSLEGVDT